MLSSKKQFFIFKEIVKEKTDLKIEEIIELDNSWQYFTKLLSLSWGTEMWRQQQIVKRLMFGALALRSDEGLMLKHQLFYPLWWLIYIFNSVVNTKLPAILSDWRSTAVSLETYSFLQFVVAFTFLWLRLGSWNYFNPSGQVHSFPLNVSTLNLRMQGNNFLPSPLPGLLIFLSPSVLAIISTYKK